MAMVGARTERTQPTRVNRNIMNMVETKDSVLAAIP